MPLSRMMPDSRPAGQADVTCIGFDQHRMHIIAAGMKRQDANDVEPLSGTQADQPYAARGCLIDRI